MIVVNIVLVFLLAAMTTAIIKSHSFMLHTHRLGPMLPFDTLLMPVSLRTRLIIAYGASMHISASIFPSLHTSTFQTNHQQQHQPQYQQGQGKGNEPGIKGIKKSLRIGFMSYDFNDHPTAHLVEGIFDVVYRRNQYAQRKYTLIIFSYGKNDGSTYRLQLEQVSENI